MKKTTLFLVLFAASVASAEQVPVTQITGVTASREALRTQINTRLVAAHDNFTEIYTLLGGSPWLAQTTAPSLHNVFWIDTAGTAPIIKYWDGDSWEVAASGGDGTYTLPSATTETKGGIIVGDRLTVTADGVLSADVQTTDISGKQDTLVSGTNIKTVNSTSLLGPGNIDISGSSIPNGTVNGQILLWATNQWVASIAPWLTTASLGEGVEAALGFAPDTAGGFLLYSTYAADPTLAFGTGLTATTNAGVVTLSVTANTYQAYDSNMILWPSAISATEVGYLDGLTGALTTLLSAKRSIADERKEIGWLVKDSDVVTAVADGKQAAVIPANMNGMLLIDVTCSVSDLNSAASGDTTIVLRRVRGATAVDMTSTGVTIAYTDYTASDEVVDTANDDVAAGDKIFVDVNTATSPAQKGLGCTAVFSHP